MCNKMLPKSKEKAAESMCFDGLLGYEKLWFTMQKAAFCMTESGNQRNWNLPDAR